MRSDMRRDYHYSPRAAPHDEASVRESEYARVVNDTSSSSPSSSTRPTLLRGVQKKRMFGCAALFVDAKIFALVWKTGRIGVRLPEASAFEELLAMKGSAPWKAGAMTMSHWVLVPEAMHDDADALAAWVRDAHAQAREGSSAIAAPSKKGAAKKVAKAPAKKKPAAKAALPKKAKKQPKAAKKRAR